MKKSFFLSILVVVFAVFTVSCGGGTGEPDKSSAKQITAVTGSIGTWQVNESAKEVTGVVEKAEHLIGVTLTLTLSPLATATPTTNLVFSANKTVTITVTAEDGTKQAYTAKATATN